MQIRLFNSVDSVLPSKLYAMVQFCVYLLSAQLVVTGILAIPDCDGVHDCQFNPDQFLNTPQIIRRHGYPAESHIVQTDDGYILTLHRIPASKNGTKGGQPIFLQHGLLSSSTDWVDTGNNSLALILSDQGYDVWLGNARGNVYSRAHAWLPLDSPKFWNFSWHDMAIHDLPAALYHISNTTDRYGDILYVGHSMGTTMFFVLASKLPSIAKNVKAMVALAPVAYMTHVTSPIRYLAPWVNDVQFLAKHLGINEFLPSNKIMKLLAFNCNRSFEKRICEDIIFVLAGFDRQQSNPDLLPVILSHIPAGTSTKTVIHYLQEISDKGDFKQFDYGKEGNMLQYGQPVPPKYKLINIKVPTYFMYADNDLLANPIDVKRLASNLTNNIGLYEVPLPNFNHIDFLFGKDAPELVYKPLINVLGNYTVD